MKRLTSTLIASIVFCLSGITIFGQNKIVVEPGQYNIRKALETAVDGDILVLKMGQTYEEDTMYISKRITIKGESVSAMPLLENLPIIKKIKGGKGFVWAFINLRNGANLTMEYVAIDNNQGETMFRPDPMDTSGAGYHRTISITVNRCRLYNVGNNADYSTLTKNMGNVFDVPADSLIIKRSSKTILSKCHFTNNIMYNIAGRGVYFKNYAGPGDWLVDNNTFYNIGQQLTYPKAMKLLGENDAPISLTFSNNTAWKISTNTTEIKEFIGMWNGTSPLANADVNGIVFTIKNNIFCHQINQTGTPQLYDVSPMILDVSSIATNIFNDCGEVFVNTTIDPGTGTGIGKVDTDPQFYDTLAADFTIYNYEWVTPDFKASKGAVYWAPGYVDEGTSLPSITSANAISMYPNPIEANTHLTFYLKNTSDVQIDIVNVNGQLVNSVFKGRLTSGNQNIMINGSSLSSGVYILKFTAGNSTEYVKTIKR